MTMYGRRFHTPKSRIDTQWRCCMRLSAARLALEARHRVLGLHRVGVEKLDGDQLTELDALGTIDHTHAARAQLVDDFPSLIDYFADECVGRSGLARHRLAV